VPAFFFDSEARQALAEKNSASYRAAEPFPHIALDDFLPAAVLDQILAEFPGRDEALWSRAEKTWETKLSCENEAMFPPAIRQLLYAFNSSPFVNFLESLTGIRGIISDPHFRGGGMHSIMRGGRLGIHADFNHYERLDLHRRLNVLLYLNKDWQEEFGGKLELWDRKMTRCVRSYAPVFNRCVIFSTTDDSFHGHPNPLECPAERSRNSLALYYYTAGRPLDELSSPHSTLFQERPNSGDKVPKPRSVFSKVMHRLSSRMKSRF
jgi:hypothetical protein